MTEIYKTDLVVIGAGPTGLFSVFEAGMLKIKCHVIDSLEVIGGQNIAIIYGFGLILLAVIMGFIYNYSCTRMENKMNKHEQ